MGGGRESTLTQISTNSITPQTIPRPTARSHCGTRRPTVLLPEISGLPGTKERVYYAKYGVAAHLALRGADFLFLEMDVFLLRDIRPLLAAYPTADMQIGRHQDNPFEFNVGFYHVTANSRSAAFFKTAHDFLRTGARR